MSKHQDYDYRVPIEVDNVSITRDDSKCVRCGACKSICKINQAVYGFYQLEETNDVALCINCGQCANVCPTGAITEVKDFPKLKKWINDPSKIVVFETAPAVRVALGDEFGLEMGTNVEEKMVAALRTLGADYVFDTTFGADVTIMEEAHEFIKRIKTRTNLPQFTSCCPAWVRYLELFFPHYLPNLSTTKSPIMIEGALIKSYFAREKNIDPHDIFHVAVTPCTAKKMEIKRESLQSNKNSDENKSIKDVDMVITTRELAEWMKESNIDMQGLVPSNYDELLPKGTGSGVIFGTSGGVMEAALRTVYHLLTGELPPPSFLELQEIRGMEGIKEAHVTIYDIDLDVAVVSGTGRAKKVLEQMESGEVHYDFIEVMACPGGCIAGGGQPRIDPSTINAVKESRMNGLYQIDRDMSIRNSEQNPDLIKLYQNYLKAPGSMLAERLLHSSYCLQEANDMQTEEIQ